MAPKAATRSTPRPERARPHRAARQTGDRGRRHRVLRSVAVTLPVPGLFVAAVLVFLFVGPVHDWMLGALGYGLIPVFLWLLSFAVVVRYRRAWVLRLWRVWVGTGMAAAVSLGILSMFNASGGVMNDASLGGYWGQYLGGSQAILGTLKVLVLVALTPLMLYPRWAGPAYRRLGERMARQGGTVLSRAASKTGTTLRDWLEEPPAPEPYLPTAARDVVTQAPPEEPWSPPSELPDKPPAARLPAPASEVAESSGSLDEEAGKPRRRKGGGWQLPSLDLLGRAEDRPVPPGALQQMARHIEETLTEHRVEVSVNDIRTGPRVIRFGLVPGWVKKNRGKGPEPIIEASRVKVQSILVREKDLALALKTPYLRLEAPVPGEALVGLEVPSPYPRRVMLRSVAEGRLFQKTASKGGMPIVLGEDTAGEPVVADLTGLPHLLIAGATGSGKSVCINSIIASLLLRQPPDRLRMLMVDPKRVELTPFNGIPHLVAPVVVDTDEVLVVLKTLQNEMLRRYKLMEGLGVRNIEGYNRKATEPMPFLVVIIDELADLMMTAAYETEQGLVRLAQLGRATGIHLILATQRPSVNVVTGLLKANIPSRIAFAVASQVDSRVILDAVGAEKLLGKGDMLLLTSDSPKPVRVQGTFVHDREIEKLVEFWQTQPGPPPPQITLHEEPAGEPKEDEGEEELMDQARDLAQRYPEVSASVLQRRLHVGFERAMNLRRRLEDEGLLSISPHP